VPSSGIFSATKVCRQILQYFPLVTTYITYCALGPTRIPYYKIFFLTTISRLGVHDSSAINDPLGAPGKTPLYLSLPFAWGTAGGDCTFPNTPGNQNGVYKELKSISNAVRLPCRQLLKYTQQRSSQSDQHPRELIMLANLGNAERSTRAGPFGLTVQGAIIGKPADQDITVQTLPTAKCKLSGAAWRTLSKTWVCQSGSGNLM
jgi:hypothetical protein